MTDLNSIKPAPHQPSNSAERVRANPVLAVDEPANSLIARKEPTFSGLDEELGVRPARAFVQQPPRRSWIFKLLKSWIN